MNNLIRLADRADSLAEVDAASGDLVRLPDRRLSLNIADQPPDWELQINRHANPLKLEFHQDGRGRGGRRRGRHSGRPERGAAGRTTAAHRGPLSRECGGGFTVTVLRQGVRRTLAEQSLAHGGAHA